MSSVGIHWQWPGRLEGRGAIVGVSRDRDRGVGASATKGESNGTSLSASGTCLRCLGWSFAMQDGPKMSRKMGQRLNSAYPVWGHRSTADLQNNVPCPTSYQRPGLQRAWVRTQLEVIARSKLNKSTEAKMGCGKQGTVSHTYLSHTEKKTSGPALRWHPRVPPRSQALRPTHQHTSNAD